MKAIEACLFCEIFISKHTPHDKKNDLASFRFYGNIQVNNSFHARFKNFNKV